MDVCLLDERGELVGETAVPPDVDGLHGLVRRLLLTATPMQLDPHELYSLIELLDPALFPTEADFNAHRKELRGLNELVEKLQRWPDQQAQELELAKREILVRGSTALSIGPPGSRR